MQDDDSGQDPQPTSDDVRLVKRKDADAAIDAGAAIRRRPTPPVDATEPAASGGPVLRVPAAGAPSVGPATRTAVRSMGTLRPVIVRPEAGVIDLRDAERASHDGPDDVEAVADGDPKAPEIDATLPHWTEPPTGEVPAAVAMTAGSGGGGGDDTPVWSLSDLGEASGLRDERNEQGDDDVDLVSDRAADNPMPGEKAPGDTTRDRVNALANASFARRVGTGVVTGALALAAFSAGPAWALTFATAVVLLSAVEYYDAVRRVGYRPATALGLVAIAGLVLGAYARGESALALVTVLATAFTFVWYLGGIIKDAPTRNIAITLMGVLWIGVFGSYAALLLREPDHRGIAFILGAVLVVVAYDTAAYIGGSIAGKHKLAASISPNKTWEGLLVGTVVSTLVGAAFVGMIHPWSATDGLILGLVVSVVAPIGDLVESMVKRDLGIKDMGRLLPGHGGALDRCDALLFVLPATYYLVRMLGLI